MGIQEAKKLGMSLQHALVAKEDIGLLGCIEQGLMGEHGKVWVAGGYRGGLCEEELPPC